MGQRRTDRESRDRKEQKSQLKDSWSRETAWIRQIERQIAGGKVADKRWIERA